MRDEALRASRSNRARREASLEKGRRQDLHGDLAAEPAVPREIHLAHPAPAERGENLAIAEYVAGSQHSRGMIRVWSPSTARRRISETGSCQIDRGYASNTVSADGLIAQSNGHDDEAEYQRRLRSRAP